MSSTAGRTLIADLDGTLVRLAVDWHALRATLGVDRIAEVWTRGRPELFDILADAERRGAGAGTRVDAGIAFACGFDAVAVLSDNAETAVAIVLAREPELARRCRAVVGRETLGGPKRDRDRFAAGITRCLAALGAEASATAYLGDAAYELGFAAELGLDPVDVASLR